MFRKIAGTVAGAFVLIVLAVYACNAFILIGTRTQRYPSIRAVPSRPVGIVFGAGLKPDQTPSRMLADRIDAGMALYHVHKVRTLLFTGDNGTMGHDELKAMLDYAAARKFPRKAIVADFAGFDTYDSCYRAKRVFGVRSAVLVTQAFHLPRAIFLCRSMGINAVGAELPDWSIFSKNEMEHEGLRETFARVKAVWEGLVTRPVPPVMGRGARSDHSF